jgi:hypothetical protein
MTPKRQLVVTDSGGSPIAIGSTDSWPCKSMSHKCKVAIDNR